MKTREDKGSLVKLYHFLLNYHFLTYNQHFHFLTHGHSSWSTFGLYLVKGPKTL